MKELCIAAHEELIQEYLDEHPDAGWGEAYEATSGKIDGRYTDKVADMADAARTRAKYAAPSIG
jgi:hypothetical protein